MAKITFNLEFIMCASSLIAGANYENDIRDKVSYEWEEDLTEAWEEWKADGYSIEEFKEKEIC